MSATPENTAVVSSLCYPSAASIPATTALLHESAREVGISVTMFEDVYPGLVQYPDQLRFDFAWLKITRLREHIRSLPSAVKYILYVDSRDVIFLRGLDAICGLYNEIGRPLLFSAENRCAPHRDPAWAARFPQQPEGFNFHNGGVYMGERGRLEDSFVALETVRGAVASDGIMHSVPFLDWNDQHVWQVGSILGAVSTGLDSTQRVFHSFHMTDWDKYDWPASCEEYPVVLKNGSKPCIAHFAGEREATIRLFWHTMVYGGLQAL